MRQYARVGNLEAAEEYRKKLMELLSESRSEPRQPLFRAEVLNSLAVFYAAKGRWEESDRYFEEAFRVAKETGLRLVEVGMSADYAWALERQGRTKEADEQRRKVQRFFDGVDEKFSHVRLDARLLAPWRVAAGEEFEMRLYIVNVSRKPCSQVDVKSLVPSEFEVVSPLATGRFEDGSFEMEDRSLGPFYVETVKLKLKASKTGTFTLRPKVFYADELGETKTCEPKPITIIVKQAKPKHEVLPGRISTGLEELDALLFGGIPEKLAVVLASPSTDEKELLVKRFLEAGAKAGEITFHITAEDANTNAIAEKYPLSLHLFLCNPQSDSMVQNMPNASKLKGVENLTDIDIALTKVFRALDSSRTGPKRICVDVVSDILLQHHAVTTRRWLSALLPTLKSKGFTILATINPKMHLQEEFEAILGIFDGEIRVTEKESPEGTSQTLKIRKLGKQKYLGNELILNREKLEQQ